ncbi:hypothetical protein SDC9_172629 [bioreactor metagenome]|uniref:Uncharacterized protein n=1 Tax=bioreactor metagenome TaxID=1076179 RepID=A0A645GGW8_9ZZZZ
MKRAQYFITCKGKYYGDVSFDKDTIENKLINKTPINSLNSVNNYEQLSIFTSLPMVLPVKDKVSALIGEL